MISLRLDDRQKRHLEKSTDNKSAYIRELINEDIKRTEPDDPFKEYQKCQNDIIYFVEQYGYYKDPSSGIEPSSTLSDFQKELLEDLANGENVIIKKGRQKRVTTTLAHFILWKLLFDPGSTIFSKSVNIDNTKNLNSRLTFEVGYKNLPEDFKVGLMRDSHRVPKLSNGSQIVTQEDKYECDVAIFEEAGFWNPIWNPPIQEQSDTQKVITYTAVKEIVYDMSSKETKKKKPENIQNEEMFSSLENSTEFESYDLTNVYF